MTKTSPSSQTEEERTYTEDEYIDYGVIQYRRGRAQAEADAEARATPAEALNVDAVKRAIRYVTDNEPYDLSLFKECARLANDVAARLSPHNREADR